MVYKRNLNDLDWTEMGNGQRIQHQRKMLTPMGESFIPKLGISLYRLERSKRAFPFHMHLANDEAILVVSGEGTLRYGDEELPLGKDDYVHLPANSGKAHQVINTGEEPLLYYCLSSTLFPEVAVYPDSEKLGTFTFTVDGDGRPKREIAFYKQTPADYFDDED